MKADANKLLNGITGYAENEVINNLPTVGKWMLGAGLGILACRASDIVESLSGSVIAKSMGLVDEEGMFDIDLMAEHLKNSANRYGRMTIQVPLIGNLTFSEADIDSLRDYIERG